MKINKIKFKKVSKEEFINFINNYPKHLDFDYCQIPEPPFASYNDYTRGMWPNSIVAEYIDDRTKEIDYKIIDNGD